MREITIAELRVLQELERDVLVKFSDYCSQNGLQWQVAYGTLLGTVRHNGFIPWDDDIDVVVSLNDYCKILKEYDNNTSEYKIQSYLNDDKHLLPWIKFRNTSIVLVEKDTLEGALNGVFIDVFPYFNISNSKIIQSFIRFKLRILISCSAVKTKKSNFLKAIFIRFLSLFLNRKTCLKRIHKIYLKCDKKYKNSDFVYMVNEFKPHLKQEVENCISMKFDNIDVFVPKGYDSLLKCNYGDYMSLPPEENRIPHHFLERFIVPEELLDE